MGRSIEYWNSRAATWNQIQGSPLVLNAQEALIFQTHAPKTGSMLVLGATPSLVDCAPHLHITSVDFAEEIVNLARRNDITYHIASWLEMPISNESQNYVVGCGSPNCLQWQDEYSQLFREVTRVMVPGGKLALRMYDPKTIVRRNHVPKFNEMLLLRDENYNVDISQINRTEYTQAFEVTYSFPPLNLILTLAKTFGLVLSSYYDIPKMNFPIIIFTKLCK